MQNARLDEAEAGIKIDGRNVHNLRYADDTKEPLDESERGEWKSWLKAQHSENKIMASGPITSWQIDGPTVADFIFLAPKSLQMVTAAMKLKDAYSLEEKLWPT